MARSPLVETALGCLPTQILYTAVDLGLADLLASGSRTGEELAAETGTHPPTLQRLLRALVALGVLTQSEPNRFGLAELGGPLRRAAPDSVYNLVKMVGSPEWWQSWGALAASVRTGEPAFDRVVGMPVFDYLGQHPDKGAMFGAAMSERTRDLAPGIAAGYDFSQFGTVVDVGGGDGTLLTHILRAAPDLQAILFDLPPGLEPAPAVLEAAGVAGRCQVVPGDFFVAVPEGADAYVMKSVIHDWDDQDAITILRNVRQAMAPDGRVLVVESVIPEMVTPEATEALVLDLIMLTIAGGEERTDTEYGALFAAAGLTMTAITEPLTPSNDRVIEATISS